MVFRASSLFAELQIRFGEQVKILRLAGMFLDLLSQFGEVELRLRLLRGQTGAIVEIVEKMLIRIRARCDEFLESV